MQTDWYFVIELNAMDMNYKKQALSYKMYAILKLYKKKKSKFKRSFYSNCI